MVVSSLIYAFSHQLRERTGRLGSATFTLDLLPGRSAEQVLAQVGHARCPLDDESFAEPSRDCRHQIRVAQRSASARAIQRASLLAATIKALPIIVHAGRPVAESISTTGGTRFDNLDSNFMLKGLPGIFAAGE